MICYKTTNVVITTFSWHVFYFLMTERIVHDDVKDVHMDPWKWNLYITQASKWLGIDIRYDSDYIICWSIHHHDNYVPSFLVLALILILYSLETCRMEITYYCSLYVNIKTTQMIEIECIHYLMPRCDCVFYLDVTLSLLHIGKQNTIVFRIM